MNQLAFPLEVTPQEIRREMSLGGAIGLCAKAAGFAPKEVQDGLKTDKAQWSRWESGAEGVIWPKLAALMDFCGNDAPLLWMLDQRGYDLFSLHKKETETEKLLREAQERIAELEKRDEIQIEILRKVRAVA